MNAPTTGKADTVTLTRREYETLVRHAELAEDIAAIRAMDADPDPVPAELVRRLVDGESPIRIFREFRGISQTALAAAAGIGKSYLSRIEGGHKTPKVTVLKALAAALGVEIDDLA